MRRRSTSVVLLALLCLSLVSYSAAADGRLTILPVRPLGVADVITPQMECEELLNECVDRLEATNSALMQQQQETLKQATLRAAAVNLSGDLVKLNGELRTLSADQMRVILGLNDEITTRDESSEKTKTFFEEYEVAVERAFRQILWKGRTEGLVVGVSIGAATALAVRYLVTR